MKKIAALVGLFVVLNLPFACNPCGPFDNRPYKIVSLSATIGSVKSGVFIDSVSTDVNTAVIRTLVDKIKQVGMKYKPFVFANAVYACEPPPPKVQKLKFITITSEGAILSDGAEYVSGSILNSLFNILDVDITIGVDEFNTSPKNFYPLAGFVGDDILIQFKVKPDTIIAQKFTLNFTFDDGLEYQVLTPVFTIK